MGVTPNFFMSEAYFDHANLTTIIEPERVRVEANGWIVFPPLPHPIPGMSKVWCDVEKLCPPDGCQKYELDWEYIFDPYDFTEMEGGKWNTFRKNVRKWPRKNPNHHYMADLVDNLAAERLMGEWLELRTENAQDANVMIKMALDQHPTSAICTCTGEENWWGSTCGIGTTCLSITACV